MKLRKIISGGQTGADQGALSACVRAGFPYGGWIPKGRRTEKGKVPARYRMRQHWSRHYPPRTEKNVVDSDGTVIFTYGKPDGGSLLTVSFFGAERVVEHYNLMGPVKATLEASVRYLAADLADQRIHVHTLSTGPVKTRAASGIDRFDELLERTRERTPANRLVDIEQIGRIAVFLASDAGMPMTGSVTYADGGFHVMA